MSSSTRSSGRVCGGSSGGGAAGRPGAAAECGAGSGAAGAAAGAHEGRAGLPAPGDRGGTGRRRGRGGHLRRGGGGGGDPAGARAGRLPGAVGRAALHRAGPAPPGAARGCATTTCGPRRSNCWRCPMRWCGAGRAAGRRCRVDPSYVRSTTCEPAWAWECAKPERRVRPDGSRAHFPKLNATGTTDHTGRGWRRGRAGVDRCPPRRVPATSPLKTDIVDLQIAPLRRAYSGAGLTATRTGVHSLTCIVPS